MGLLGDIADHYQLLPEWLQLLTRLAVVTIVGFGMVRTATYLIVRGLSANRRIDKTVNSFVTRLVHIAGHLFLTMILLGMIGVDVGAMIGSLAIGGLVLGFALKDSLGNLAAGFMLLFYRPFNVDDIVEVDKHMGNVIDLGFALTTIRQYDGQIVTIPNGAVLGGAIVNFSREPNRRVKCAVGIAYDDDIDTAVRAILAALPGSDARILTEPAPAVIIKGLGPSSVDLEVRVWTRNDDFGGVNATLAKTVKTAIGDAGCTIPFPQQDVHLIDSA